MRLTILLLLCFLCSCRVGPKYHPPMPAIPENWKNDETTNSQTLPKVCYWWEVFQDPDLNALENQAVGSNPNIQIAMGRIEEAWALAGVNLADLYPTITLTPGYSNTEQLFKLYLPPAARNNPLFPIDTFLSQPFRAHILQYTFLLNLNYELDLWGKYRSRLDSSLAHVQSEQEAYTAAILSLTSDVANSYFQLRSMDAIIDVLEKTIALRRKKVEIAQTRYRNGLTGSSDVSSASLELANTEADHSDAVRQRGLQENIIAALIGLPASDFKIPPKPLVDEPPQIPSGIPLRVVQQRPDIAQAERTMASQHALIGAAYAELYPSLSLTGAVGFLSPTARDFFTWLSRYWSYGVDVFESIFDAGKRESNIQAEWARFAQATGSYRQTVLTAFREVEDALNNLEYQKKQSDSLKSAVGDATTLSGLSTNRYQKGLTNYIEVITNERSELDAKRNYLTVLGLRYQSTVMLIKALGGGWEQNSDCLTPNAF